MLIISDERMTLHDPGEGHPERPDRLRAATAALRDVDGLRWEIPEPASAAQIERVHDHKYVEQVVAARGKRAMIDPDTVLSTDSVDAAELAAGAGIRAVTAVWNDEAPAAFALVRPPGHHAEAQAGRGFCLFNNVAVAAEHALAALGAQRVLIVDWDVHHGNGTQHSFFGRRDVLFMSLHQFPFYPGSGDVGEAGRGEGEGYNVNVPFPAGCGDGDYMAAFEDVLLPIADAYGPDLVLVSAGYDAHRADPLGGMRATEEGYAAMASLLQGVAKRHAGGKIALFLEGGYDLDALGRSVRATVEALAGSTPPEVGAPDRGAAIVKRVAEHHRSRYRVER